MKISVYESYNIDELIGEFLKEFDEFFNEMRSRYHGEKQKELDEKSDEKPAEKPAEKPVEKIAEKPVEKSDEKNKVKAKVSDEELSKIVDKELAKLKKPKANPNIKDGVPCPRIYFDEKENIAYEAVKFNSVKTLEHDRTYYTDTAEGHVCSGCGAKSGQYHALGCKHELCPKCGKPIMECKCFKKSNIKEFIANN